MTHELATILRLIEIVYDAAWQSELTEKRSLVTLATTAELYALDGLREQSPHPDWPLPEKTQFYLLPHLQRAARLGQRLEAGQFELVLLREALHQMPQSVFIVSASRRVIFANHRARQMLLRNDGLTLNPQGELEASQASDQRRLQQLIANAGRYDASLQSPRNEMLQLARPSGLPPLSLLIVPLCHEFSRAHSAVLILLADAELQIEALEGTLQQLYALTPAEARLAALLAQGKSLAASAAELRVTQNTARTHLKSIFHKTAVNRQSELVRLLLNFPAVAR